MKKRILSILLAVCMVLMLAPTTAFASDDGLVNVSEKVVFNKQDTYPYTGEPVDFSPTCDDIKEWSFEYLDSNGSVLDDAPYEPGKYTVIITGYGTDCSARIEHTYRIVTGEIKYTVSGYSGEYDGKEHSITVEYDPNVFTVEYSKDGGASWQNENPGFKDVGSYTVHVRIWNGNELFAEPTATVTISKGTPELYFTPGNIVFKPGEKSRKLEWVYTGDGKLHFTSSDPKHFWVDPSGGLVSLNQEGGVSIWATSPETSNWKSVTAMCIVETESTLPQIDIDTKLDIDYQSGETEYLVEKVQVNGWDGNPVLYIDAKLLDPRDPEQKKELHNVRASFTVPYKKIQENSSTTMQVPATAYDFAVLHQQIDNKIEEVPFIPRANGLRICDTTCSPFAIVCLPKENYNLYYDVNGGTGTPLNQSVRMDSESYSVTLSSEKPSRAGYKFEGWSTSSDGSVQYMPGDTITLDRDIILYAIWTEKTNTYTVKFNTDGGNTILDKNVHWTDKVLDGISAPTKNGWEFTGWKCGDTSVTENTTYGDLAVNDTTASITLVAQWKYITAPTGESDYKPTTPTQPTKPTEPIKPTNPTDNEPQIKGDDGKTDNVSTDEQNPSTGVMIGFGALIVPAAVLMISRKKKK